jgi:outer membrane protein
MKRLLILLGLTALCTLPVQAQQKIGTIDLQKVFDGYYKTKEADTGLKDEAADLEKERKEMIESFRKGEDEYKRSLDKSNDQAVSSEERDKSKQKAEQKLIELKELEQTITTFERSARAKLAEKQRRKRDTILDEIRGVISAKAKTGSYTLVIDTAAKSVNDTPIVLFNANTDDLTDGILKELNSAVRPAKPEAETKAPEKKDEKK